MWGTVINYFRFFFLLKKLGFGAFTAGKKAIPADFSPFPAAFCAFPLQHVFLKPCSAAGQGPDPLFLQPLGSFQLAVCLL